MLSSGIWLMATHKIAQIYSISTLQKKKNLLAPLQKFISSSVEKYMFHAIHNNWWYTMEKEMATHSSILAWRSLWTEEPGGLLSMGSHRVGHNWSNLACMHALEKEMATHSSILAWRLPGTGEPGGLPSMGSHRVSHDWSDLAAAAATNDILTISSSK